MVRVLVTVEPRMYREAIALAIQHHRPDAEVMLVPESVMDGQASGFAPHVLVRNDGDDGFVPEELLEGVVCRVEVLYSDSMATRVSMEDRSYTVDDACMDDLLAIVDEAEGLAFRHRVRWAAREGLAFPGTGR